MRKSDSALDLAAKSLYSDKKYLDRPTSKVVLLVPNKE